MVIRKPYRPKTMLAVAGCASLSALVAFTTLKAAPEQKANASLSQFSSGNAPRVSADINNFARPDTASSALPSVLSREDRLAYSAAYQQQKKSDWTAADIYISRVHNPILMGHMLAQRYLHRNYDTSPTELADWLAHYSDHPEAADIYALAIAKQSSLRQSLPVIRKQAKLDGYGDDNGLGTAENGYKLWRYGLDAWQRGNKQEAAKFFSSLAKQDGMSDWRSSAAAYWAYRSYHALSNTQEAQRYLQQAAEEPRSFYGILARKQLRQPLELDAKPPSLSDNEALELFSDTSVRRIIALSQAGMQELAEQELRYLFPQASSRDKQRLLTLAYHLNLASVQISMARQLSRDGLDYARYPVPHWQPSGGFTIEPSLLYALMRQESGFHAGAVSSVGALGLMQLMPKTASLMNKQQAKINQEDGPANFSEPVLNMTLGQNYIQHLLDINLVDRNLIYLLAAYNAGPGRLQEWKQSISQQDDPLLFIETIPFLQTRNYIVQVMTNYWIYSEMAGNSSNSSITALLKGQWPSYDSVSQPVATASADHAG